MPGNAADEMRTFSHGDALTSKPPYGSQILRAAFCILKTTRWASGSKEAAAAEEK